MAKNRSEGVALNATFAQEADDLLSQIEEAALALEAAPDDREHVNLLFRAFHTIKGSAGMVGLDEISAFTHHVENALDRVREGALSVTPELIGAILAAKDHIQGMLVGVAQNRPPDIEHGAGLIATFAKLGGAKLSTRAQGATSSGLRTTFSVVFRLKREEHGGGVDADTLLRGLRELGMCEVVQTEDEDGSFGPTYNVTLTTQRDEGAIRDLFLFVPGGSELHIEAGLSEFVTAPPAAVAAAPVTRGEPAAEPSPARPESGSRARRADETVRVPSARLDQLVKLVGELVINQSRLQQAQAQLNTSEFAGPVEAMERLISELRDSVFGIRMMPIGPTFSRFKRLARDLSAQLGKEIELCTEGDETELDKTVLDRLGDPLVHLIRNSMDHGVELPEQRTLAGKPRKGRILLTAAHEGGHVLITIQDDGRGLNAAMIRAKAEEKGLIERGAHLSEQETIELIMRPGFSTAQAVTQLSGRGVGMDVVKKTIESLRGSLQIASTVGQGTTMRLTLPLTLAIIDGLLVKVHDEHFIIPMAAVTENVELHVDDELLHRERHAVTVRGELVPYFRLRELFDVQGSAPATEKVVIVVLGGQRIGLVVDSVIGSHQTVIQPLGPFYRSVEPFSGTTILGDGRVVMILDLAGTLRYAERASRRNSEGEPGDRASATKKAVQ